MLTTVIDKDTMLRLLDEVVEERGGDFVYQAHFGNSCVYVRRGEPACIIGAALWPLLDRDQQNILEGAGGPALDLLGWTTMGELPGYDDPGYLSRLQLDDECEAELALEATEAAAKVALIAQRAQDDGRPYGFVQRLAHELADLLGDEQ